jgi:hypothetical protein
MGKTPSRCTCSLSQLRTGNDDDYDAIELLRRHSMKELSIERFIRRANARRKSIRREDFYRRLCLAWVNHFHGQLNKISVPPTGSPPHGPLRGPGLSGWLVLQRRGGIAGVAVMTIGLATRSKAHPRADRGHTAGTRRVRPGRGRTRIAAGPSVARDGVANVESTRLPTSRRSLHHAELTQLDGLTTAL